MKLDELIQLISNIAGITVNQSMLADSLGITRQTISNRIKTQSEVTVSEIRRVEEFFKISIFSSVTDDIAYIDYYTDVLQAAEMAVLSFRVKNETSYTDFNDKRVFKK